MYCRIADAQTSCILLIANLYNQEGFAGIADHGRAVLGGGRGAESGGWEAGGRVANWGVVWCRGLHIDHPLLL
jgi:hypothetical protein